MIKGHGQETRNGPSLYQNPKCKASPLQRTCTPQMLALGTLSGCSALICGLCRFYRRYQLHGRAYQGCAQATKPAISVTGVLTRRASLSRSLPELNTFRGEFLMKHFALWMAFVGLAATGCAQNRVFGPHARRGGANFQMARSQSQANPTARREMNEPDNSEVELASYGGGRCRDCCGGLGACDDMCCGGACDDTCCGGCCDTGCADAGCMDGCCGGGSCAIGGGCAGGSCGLGSGGGCSACGGQGCGLCQRIAGRVASGCCPHAGGYPASYNYNPSPPTGQVAYPYYTVRGPRDFLRNNPPSIGPY